MERTCPVQRTHPGSSTQGTSRVQYTGHLHGPVHRTPPASSTHTPSRVQYTENLQGPAYRPHPESSSTQGTSRVQYTEHLQGPVHRTPPGSSKQTSLFFNKGIEITGFTTAVYISASPIIAQEEGRRSFSNVVLITLKPG